MSFGDRLATMGAVPDPLDQIDGETVPRHQDPRWHGPGPAEDRTLMRVARDSDEWKECAISEVRPGDVLAIYDEDSTWHMDQTLHVEGWKFGALICKPMPR